MPSGPKNIGRKEIGAEAENRFRQAEPTGAASNALKRAGRVAVASGADGCVGR
jgi:hypothetical protein